MVVLLYETSSSSLISLEDSNGVSELRVEVSNPPNTKDFPVVTRDQIPLANDDVYILDSIKSGVGSRTVESGIYGRVIRPLFDDIFQIKHTYVGTESVDTIKDFATKLTSSGKPITVVIIAGDTSVNEFLNSLSATSGGSIKVLIVPAGTGNSLALSIGIADEARAIRKLFSYKLEDVRPFNLYESAFPEGSRVLRPDGTTVDFKNPLLFTVVTSWAFHASLVADSDTEELRKEGIARFRIAAENNLARPQVYEGELVVRRENGQQTKREGPFAYFVVTPSKKFEPTFDILPQGNIFDTNLYIVGFSSGENIMDIMKEVYDGGKHVNNGKVFYERVEQGDVIELKVSSEVPPHDRRFCVDGAIVVLPDKGDGVLSLRYHGHNVRGWDISIIS